MTEIVLNQGRQPDCTLASVMNCAKLNNPDLDRLFTQELLDKYMPEYNYKSIREAFYFLKDKGHELKFIEMSFAKAKVLMKKGRAMCCRLRYTQGWVVDMLDDRIVNGSKDITFAGSKGHAFAIKMIGDKYYVYDSNFKKPYEIDIDKMVKDKIVRTVFYQIR